MMRIFIITMLIFLEGCGLIGKGPHLIADDTDCKYNYYFGKKTLNPENIIRVLQRCKKGEYMNYYFTQTDSVWKINGILRKINFMYLLVYDSSYEIKLTNAEIELFGRITHFCDSLSIQKFENLRKATGFVKVSIAGRVR
jgi:hypothetical protein